jgi:hypothetical protein
MPPINNIAFTNTNVGLVTLANLTWSQYGYAFVMKGSTSYSVG